MSCVGLPNGRVLIDIFVAPADSPTKKAIRFRRRFARTFDEGKRLDAEITLALRTEGMWEPVSAPHRSLTVPARVQGSLDEALRLAWSDPSEGWINKRGGVTLERAARFAIDILGGARRCATITRDDYNAIRTALTAKGNSEATIIHRLQAFHRVLYFAELKGWIKARPRWKRLPLNNARIFTYSAEMEQQVVDYFSRFDPDMAAIFLLGIDCGMRLNEVLTIEGARVDLRRGLAHITEELAKSGQFRRVVLVPRALDILKARVEKFGNGLLFPGWYGSKVDRRMRDARDRIDPGNTEFVYHATRHTCGTRMAERGVPLAHMMEQLGHRTPTMTMRYIHLAADERRTMILEKMTPDAVLPAELAQQVAALRAQIAVLESKAAAG